MNKLKYIFDFDRTLFNTDAFFDDLLKELISLYNIEPNKTIKEQDEFRDADGNHYDFFGHMNLYTNDEPMQIIRKTWLGFSGNYLFEDAKLIINDKKIRQNSQILTLGEPKFQHFKLSVAGLHRFPHIIIRKPKIPYIVKNILKPNQPLVLVDDKASTFKYPTPKELALYQICRETSQQKTSKSNVTIIQSLVELDLKN